MPSEGPDRAALLHAPRSERAAAVVDAVRALAGDLDLDPDGAGVLRAGTAVVVGLPRAGVLVRVDDGAGWGSAGRQVAFARAAGAGGVPVVRLADVGDQPRWLDLPGHARPAPATCWVWEDVAPGVASSRAIGELAARLHAVPVARGAAGAGRAGTVRLPPVEPLEAVVRQVGETAPSGVASRSAGSVLLDAQRSLEGRWSALVARREPRLVHGDLHAGNVLPTERGAVLVDLELAGVGPAAYDLAPQVVAVRRYGAPPSDLGAFLDGYGAPLPPPDDLAVAVATFELWVTAWAVGNRDLDAAHEAEAELRLVRWRTEPVLPEVDRPEDLAVPPGTSPPWTLR